MALPGVITVLQDSFSTITRTSVPQGPSIVVIGKRLTPDGTNGIPSLTPYMFQSEADVVTTFGYGSDLHRGYLEVVAGGGVTVSLLALPFGTQDSDLLSTTSGNVFDSAFDNTAPAQPDIIVPWGRGGHPNEWTSASATPDYPPASPDIIPPQGFQADNSANPTTSLAVRVANKMAEITSDSNPCFAVMGVTSVSSTNPVSSPATELVNAATLSTYLTFPNLIAAGAPAFNDTGPYLSIVATEARPVTYPINNPATTGIGTSVQTGSPFGYSNGAGLYAGFVSTLASYNAPTGQNPFNISGIRWIPTLTQQNTISTSQIVPLATNYLKIPVWVDAPTYSAPSSDYARLTTLRIIFDAVQLVRAAATPFIGQGSTLANRTAFDTAISSALRSMTIAGALTASDYNITYTPASNSAEVDLVLTPAFEIRNITISISINLG